MVEDIPMPGVRMRYRVATLWLVLALLAAACGDGSSEAEDTPETGSSEPPTTTTSGGTEIGPAGGTVTSSDGALTVEVPPGAVTDAVSITIEPIPASDLGLGDIDLAGPVYRLGPDGTEFAVPVTITRILSASQVGYGDRVDVPFVHVFQGEGDGWEPLSTETSRLGDEITVVATSPHFSANAAVVSADVLVNGQEADVQVVLKPGTNTALVGSSFEATWILSGEDVDTSDRFITPNSLTSTGAVARFELNDRAPWTGVVHCGATAGEGTYAVTIRGSVDPDFTLADAVYFAFFRAFPSEIPYTLTAVGSAVCTDTDQDDGSGTSGDGQQVLLPSGSYGGTMSFVPEPDGAPYDQEFLVSFVPPETAEVVLTEEAKEAVGALRDATRPIGDAADPFVVLSQILPNGSSQNTFGTLVTLSDGHVLLVTTAVEQSYRELYLGTVACTAPSPPCQAIMMELVNVGGDESLTLDEATLEELRRFLDGETDTLTGEYQWAARGTGTLPRETGQGDG